MFHDLVAVTIGIGETHAQLARLAAERMRQGTGLDVRILDESDLAAEGLTEPFDLKFRLFNRTAAENVLFFDADVFCLRPWNPRQFLSRSELVAVRGWWFDPWVERLGPVYGFGDDIFNAGMFLCNRKYHADVLRLAEALQTEDDRFHGLTNPDEIALNAARAILKTPVKFLDRRHNWVQYGYGTLDPHADVILAHSCASRLRGRYAAGDPLPLFRSEPSVRGAVDSEVAGKTFIYDRVGYDLRPMQFRQDGTIGIGHGGAERFWFTTPGPEGPQLVIGSELDQTCTLHEDPNGVWQGRWSNYERMPVKLNRHRAQVLVDLVRQRFGFTKPLRGAEIGVYLGETSAILLRELPQLHLHLVDPWRVPVVDSDYRRTNASDSTFTQAMYDEAMVQAARATEFAAERRSLVPCQSHAAASVLPIEFDFVFVDGDHSYSGVLRDIETWWPKLGSDGILTGHDYGHPAFPGVERAVHEFATRNALTVRTDSDMVWYYEKN